MILASLFKRHNGVFLKREIMSSSRFTFILTMTIVFCMVCYFVVQYYSFNDLVHVNHFYMDAQKAVKYDQVKPTIFDADKVGKD